MVRGSVARRLVGVLGSWLILAVAAPAAQAFEYLEGAIQVHGYFEETVRAISRDFNQSLDLTQWYHTLHIEMDIDIAKDGWGPFDSVGAYIGAEVRYDCVWTRACGFSPSVNVYGNRSSSLPSRLDDAKDPRMAGTTNYRLRSSGAGPQDQDDKIYSGNLNPLRVRHNDPGDASCSGGPAPAAHAVYRGANQAALACLGHARRPRCRASVGPRMSTTSRAATRSSASSTTASRCATCEGETTALARRRCPGIRRTTSIPGDARRTV